MSFLLLIQQNRFCSCILQKKEENSLVIIIMNQIKKYYFVFIYKFKKQKQVRIAQHFNKIYFVDSRIYFLQLYKQIVDAIKLLLVHGNIFLVVAALKQYVSQIITKRKIMTCKKRRKYCEYYFLCVFFLIQNQRGNRTILPQNVFYKLSFS